MIAGYLNAKTDSVKYIDMRRACANWGINARSLRKSIRPQNPARLTVVNPEQPAYVHNLELCYIRLLECTRNIKCSILKVYSHSGVSKRWSRGVPWSKHSAGHRSETDL